MLDEYLNASVSRISPEAPVAVANIKNRNAVPGGAANVARNLARLGCDTYLAGFSGKDKNSKELAELITESDVNSLIYQLETHPTICKTRVIAQGHQLIRLDREESGKIAVQDYEGFWELLRDNFLEFNAVILSDYKKGVLNTFNGQESIAQRVINLCVQRGIPVLVDPKGVDWSRYVNATCVTPNVSELSQVLDVAPENSEALYEGGAHLIKSLNLNNLVLTRSEKGMTLIESSDKFNEIPAKAKEVTDVSGAGDTVIAVLGACVAKGLSWEDAVNTANLAAGIVVSKAGTSPIELYELEEAVLKDQQSKHSYNYKFFNSKEELYSVLNAWRKKGQRIVFTNGCFDLIHAGHIQLLREAAMQGDKLIVALNSDASIKKLKGPSRPMQSQQSRALIISAFQDVDAVIIFDEETPQELIKYISPDVLVKGGDYKVEDVVGARHVRQYGGKVYISHFLNGFSTTKIIEKINQN